ncbi:MAG: helix-turn-helix domain-containing protein [Deltaproteobacteria bacterium]|nr:helix-turn-helix domain-containing protein [Deltaproteobacteria bacterium]
MKVAILCLDQVFDSAVHIVRDVLGTAARLSPEAAGKRSLVSTLTLDGDPITTASRQTLAPDGAIGDSRGPDVIVLPGIVAERGVETLGPLLQGACASRVTSWLVEQHHRGAEIATACTGTWFIAQTGLLNGFEATTTWHLASPFRERFPEVDLQIGKMVTYGNRIRCAGAAMAHMDLALSLVTNLFGGRISREVASLLLLDGRSSQAQYMITEHLQGSSEDFRRIDAWIREHVGESFAMRDLAKAAGLSQRTLARRVWDTTGETPLKLVQRIRVEKALHLLETTSWSFSEITFKVGYEEPATLRRLIRNLTGRSPSEIRSRSNLDS